jgi:hypothetical protein
VNEARLLGLVDKAVSSARIEGDRVSLPWQIWAQIVIEVVPPTLASEPVPFASGADDE